MHSLTNKTSHPGTSQMVVRSREYGQSYQHEADDANYVITEGDEEILW